MEAGVEAATTGSGLNRLNRCLFRPARRASPRKRSRAATTTGSTSVGRVPDTGDHDEPAVRKRLHHAPRQRVEGLRARGVAVHAHDRRGAGVAPVEVVHAQSVDVEGLAPGLERDRHDWDSPWRSHPSAARRSLKTSTSRGPKSARVWNWRATPNVTGLLAITASFFFPMAAACSSTIETISLSSFIVGVEVTSEKSHSVLRPGRKPGSRSHVWMAAMRSDWVMKPTPTIRSISAEGSMR